VRAELVKQDNISQKLVVMSENLQKKQDADALIKRQAKEGRRAT